MSVITQSQDPGIEPETQSEALGQPKSAEPRSALERLTTGPAAATLFGIALALLYWPMFHDLRKIWDRDKNVSHGILIFPLAAGLIWMERDRIRQAVRAPQAWGLLVLAAGLALETFSYQFHVKFLGLWSLLVVLPGLVLAAHGPALWRIVRFPILFLFFAGPLPAGVYMWLSSTIQGYSTIGAAGIMNALGYDLLRIGNAIQVPGYTLEVASVCSGYQKLIALIAFSLLYGHVVRAAWWQRGLLMLSAFPIALVTNAMRIAGLIIIIQSGGQSAFEKAHDAADMVALMLSFCLFVTVGWIIGCKKAQL